MTKSWRLLTPGQILTSDSIECYLDKNTEWIQNIQWPLYLHINDILGSSNILIDSHRFSIINKYICIYFKQIYWVRIHRILTWDISNLPGQQAELLRNFKAITPQFQKMIRVLVTVSVLVLDKFEPLLGSLLLVTDFVTLLTVWQVLLHFQFRFQRE